MSKSVTPESSPQAESRKPFTARYPRFIHYLRLLKYFVLSCIIMTMMEVGYAYWLISSRWHLFLDRPQMVRMTNEINSAATPVNAKFMEVYTKLFPNHVHTTLSQQVFINYGQRILLRHTDIDDKPHCFCDLVYDIQIVSNDELAAIEWDGRLQDLEYGFGIEKFTTPEKCFNYVTNFRLEELQTKLRESGRFRHLQKPMEEFTDDDFIELIIMLKTQRKVTRYRNLTQFEREMNAYREKLTKARLAQQAASK